MIKYIYVVNKCSRLCNTTITKCLRAFEDIVDADVYFSALAEDHKDDCGVWFEIQRCEIEVQDE